MGEEMTPTLPTPKALSDPLEDDFPLPDVLPYSDGVPVDSDWQVLQMQLLRDILETNWKGRRFYCAGNMFLYFSPAQVRNREFPGPDFFVTLDVEHDRMRKYWAIWEENGRQPDIVFELISPTTEREDRTTKKDIYEQKARIPEYVCYDPETEEFDAWRLDGRYRPIVLEADRLWSERLSLWIGKWQGMYLGHSTTWVRFFNQKGEMLPTGGEHGTALAMEEAAHAKRADTISERATVRAQAAEAENEHLKKELEALRQQAKLTAS